MMLGALGLGTEEYWRHALFATWHEFRPKLPGYFSRNGGVLIYRTCEMSPKMLRNTQVYKNCICPDSIPNRMFRSDIFFAVKGCIGQMTRWLDRILGKPCYEELDLDEWWLFWNCNGMLFSLSRYLKYICVLGKSVSILHKNIWIVMRIYLCPTSTSCFFAKTWTLSRWMRTNMSSWFIK